MTLYLLDTNAASALWDYGSRDHAHAIAYVQARGDDLFFVSRVTVAEVRYGYELCAAADPVRKQAILKNMAAFSVREIGEHTIAPYAALRAAVFRLFGTPKKRGLIKEKRPESLLDQTTGKELGIQENDLWIAAISVEYGMILVSDDRMSRIRDAATTLSPQIQFRCEGWKPSATPPTGPPVAGSDPNGQH